MTLELALRNQQSIALSPGEVVSNASEQAKLLMDIVEKTRCFQMISGKKYLQVEAWETIGAFNRVHAVTESITPIMSDGVKVGYDAKVTLVNQNGVLVGAAIMPCYFTENACKGKEGDAKDKACKSAAQTFATSKAYRMNYSYVAILAGYQPTPAEEMTGEAIDDRPANLQHWCEEHKTKFFKTVKMKGYAHQLEGGGWHNESFPEKPPSKTTITFTRPPSTTLEDAQNSVIAGDKGMIAPEPEGSAVTADNQGGKVSLATSDDLARLTSEMRNAKWDMFRLGKYIKEQGWAVTKTKELTTAQVDEAIKDILADSVK